VILASLENHSNQVRLGGKKREDLFTSSEEWVFRADEVENRKRAVKANGSDMRSGDLSVR
jgi:hypothetical protein